MADAATGDGCETLSEKHAAALDAERKAAEAHIAHVAAVEMRHRHLEARDMDADARDKERHEAYLRELCDVREHRRLVERVWSTQTRLLVALVQLLAFIAFIAFIALLAGRWVVV